MIIGITGQKQNGKDTAGLILEENGWMHVNFADPLKEICKEAFGLTYEEMNDQTLKETQLTRWPKRTPRELMQRVGSDMFRKYYPDVWIAAYARRINKKAKIYTTDVRFLNEAKLIGDLGGKIVRIKRPFLVSKDTHISETEMAQIKADLELTNREGDEGIRAMQYTLLGYAKKLAR